MRRPCFFLNSINSGSRAIVPSSCRISQSTPAGCETGHARQIDRRLRVARAPQHAAVLGAQRKDVARLHEILRLRLGIRDRLNRGRAIVRADPGGHAARGIHRDGEIGPIHLPVLRHHPLQTELLRALVRDRHADQAAAVHGHEIDRLRRGFLRRHDEVALVLAIRIVGHDHEPALRDVLQDIVDGIELKSGRRLS